MLRSSKFCRLSLPYFKDSVLARRGERSRKDSGRFMGPKNLFWSEARLARLMGNFVYQGIDRQGHTVRGTMAAKDEVNLEERLRKSASGWWRPNDEPERAIATKAGSAPGWVAPSRPRDAGADRFLHADELSAPRRHSRCCRRWTSPAADCPQPAFQRHLQEIRRMVEAGEALNEGMSRFPRVFSPHFISLIRAGENSSAVPESFGAETVPRMAGANSWRTSAGDHLPGGRADRGCLFVLILFTFVIRSSFCC